MGEFANQGLVIHTIETITAVKLGGVSSVSIPLNTETVSDESGQTHDTFRAISKQSPVPAVTTSSVMLALQALTPDGACINSDVTHPGVKIYEEQKEDCSTGSVASNAHAEYLVDAGFMSPQQLSASRGETATLSMAFDALSKGGNSPLAGDYSATLPTGLDISQFVLGAVKVGNILFPDIRSLTLDFGIELTEKTPQLGGVWPETVGRSKARPKASITAKDPTYLGSTKIPQLGKAAAHADTIFYFKKRKNQSAFELDATLVHFSLTMSGLVLVENAFSASGTATGDIAIDVQGINDGTNNPLILTPNIAYDPTP